MLCLAHHTSWLVAGRRLLPSGFRALEPSLVVSPKIIQARSLATGAAPGIRPATQDWPAGGLYGQPVSKTHSHMLAPDELTPGISAAEYKMRRATLMKQLPIGSVVILAASDVKYRSGAVFHAFRQESNFLYLTGFSEPDSLCILEKTGPGLDDFSYKLFVLSKNQNDEQWMGPRTGVKGATEIFQADEAYDIQISGSIVQSIVDSANAVYTDMEHRITPSLSYRRIYDAVKGPASKHRLNIRPLRHLLNQLRVTKSPAEIANMAKAGSISGKVLNQAMSAFWGSERELHAYLDYTFIMSGLDGPAYIPVVAGGERGSIIHYVQNNQLMDNRDLVLVDAGGEYGTYITDITRTWPNAGMFTKPEYQLYEAVLRVQERCISLCRESASLSLDEIHDVAVESLREELSTLGFNASAEDIKTLFPHHVGHYIGLDVHDCPGYSRGVKLKEGFCVTMEPGIYVPSDRKWPDSFRGLGVRIEDSIAVGKTEPYVLTASAIKQVAEIEALRETK
ncbi:Intermediate cleaving peptidase 55 [Ceratocystis fimbriata CBS 114723]|uniref:Xaa-Pro aminopeptidase n=1 Tax=Ceratocystis fimbriata CBS 114723 TaxID=1035309 RepID=A0A2C5XE03_9PEZI|nr:Intermediate cleaving peptidase 55 [Ceratocystis fimbriata CBS 114723]